MSADGAKRLQALIDRALAPLEALHSKFAATDPGVILTCPGRPPLIRYSTGEYSPETLSQLKAALAATGRGAMLRDENGRRLSPREIVERFGVLIDAREYARLARHRTNR